MDTCIFCKMVKGEIQPNTVYEDDNFLGFLDIFPRAKGHTLLIPKTHYRWVYDVPEFGTYWETARLVARKLQKTFNPEFISFITYGLDAPHAHIHVVPRYSGETEAVFPQVKKTTPEELAEIAKILRAV
ncbi:HIT family protein [Candidatus Roizmanbacteria bacterium]|nr:HIT family protein [Candidatus Roizmanbacteria bacterium]